MRDTAYDTRVGFEPDVQALAHWLGGQWMVPHLLIFSVRTSRRAGDRVWKRGALGGGGGGDWVEVPEGQAILLACHSCAHTLAERVCGACYFVDMRANRPTAKMRAAAAPPGLNAMTNLTR
jgi:hypothetical protein